MIMIEMNDEPPLEPPQKINNQKHYVGINVINFEKLKRHD